jgi:hypothetical protein
MKKLFISLFCFISLGLHAAQYHHKISITPLPAHEEGKKQFLAKIELTKQLDENSEPFLIDVPKIICLEGELAEVKNESPDTGDLLVIKIFIPENQSEAQASILLQEGNAVVLSSDETVKISNFRVIRHWSDRREQLIQENLK